MENKFIASSDCWFIINSEGNVYHGKLDKDGIIETKNVVETFSTEAEWKTALSSLGVELENKPVEFVPESRNPKTNPIMLEKARREKRLEELKKSN